MLNPLNAFVSPFLLIFLLCCWAALPSWAQQNTDNNEQITNQENPASKQSVDNAQSANAEQTKNKKTDSTVIAPQASYLTHSEDLKHFVGEITQPILVGTKEYITLVAANKAQNDQGVAILLPNWQSTATSPHAINHLRASLTTAGWTTITIQPLDKPQNYPSYAEKKSAREAQDNEKLTPYKEDLTALLAQVMENALDYPGIIMLIVEGENAAFVHQVYQNAQFAKPNILIMLSAYTSTEDQQALFLEQFSNLEVATLDLYLTKDHPFAIEGARQRKVIAQKSMKPMYRQRQLSNTHTAYYPQEKLTNQITRWLRKVGW